MFTRILVIPGLVAMLASASCSPAGGPQQQTPKTGSDIVVGVPNAVTGAYNVEGPLTQQGFDIWADWTNARGGIEVQGVRHKVRLISQDDQSNPQLDGQIADQMLTQQGAQFLFAPYGSPGAVAVAQVAEKHQVPVVAASAGAREVFMQGLHYLFGILSPVDQFVAAVDDWELSLNPKPKTLAIITADDPASKLITQGAVTYAGSHGIQVVYLQSYPSGTTNLYPLVQAAKAKNPDIFFNSGHFLEAVAAHKAAKDLMLDAKSLQYGVGPAQPEFIQALGPIADYAVTASPWTPQARFKADYGPSSADFVAAYEKKYNTQIPPGFVTADATAAGLALEMAIMKANSLDPVKVRDALAGLDANTFYGRIKFDAQGQNTFHNVLVIQIQGGKQQLVWPQEMATATAVWPTPTWESRFGAPAQPPKAALPKTGSPPRHR